MGEKGKDTGYKKKHSLYLDATRVDMADIMQCIRQKTHGYIMSKKIPGDSYDKTIRRLLGIPLPPLSMRKERQILKEMKEDYKTTKNIDTTIERIKQKVKQNERKTEETERWKDFKRTC